MHERQQRQSRIRRWWSFAAYLWSQLREAYDDYRQYQLGGTSGLVLGDGIVWEGTPLLMVSGGGRVIIGSGVVLDSRNRGYHANMFGPVKLIATTPGALIEIGERSRIHGTCIHARERVQIGKRCLVAANCQILDSNGHDLAFDAVHRRLNTRGHSRPVAIGDDVWLGAGCIVLPGVTIGSGTVVGAGSVVTSDLPPMCLAAGMPAKVLKQY